MTALKLDTPFIIIGSGSSGTTLLSVLLDRHPEIACGPEIGVFSKRSIYEDFKTFQQTLPAWLQRGLSTEGNSQYRPFFLNLEAYFWEKDELIALANETNNHREFFDRFFTRYLERRGKALWGEKSLENAYCVREFLELYPNARVIHMVRDARDVVCSLRKREDIPYRCVAQWLYNVAASYAVRDVPGYMEVFYEKLVTEPETQMKRIFEHIGVEYDPNVFTEQSSDAYWSQFSKGNIHKSWRQSPIGNKISAASVGQYKKLMTPEMDAILWKMRLTPVAKRKLKISYETVADLMCHYGYINERQRAHTRVEPALIGEGMVHGWVRFKREYFIEKRLWLPLTWVPPW